MSAFHSHRFCVAPMMDGTDRHCRYFHRQLSKRAFLYTDMIHTNAILKGGATRHLKFNAAEHPVALQLGGNEPDALARCAALAEKFGYDEVNLNCGCPSDRVLEGRFGACLMQEPKHVAECVRAMRSACKLPITIKNRIGVDDTEEYEFLRDFVSTIADAGCNLFIIHARKAWLKGLTPKENREIPPLRYEVVYRLKQEFPQISIIINGGIKTLDQCSEHLKYVDGVMLGREPYDNPYLLAGVDSQLFGDTAAPPAREQVLMAVRAYAENLVENEGLALHHITRHILGLYKGQNGGRAFRRTLSEGVAHGEGVDLLDDALEDIYQSEEQLRAA